MVRPRSRAWKRTKRVKEWARRTATIKGKGEDKGMGQVKIEDEGIKEVEADGKGM